MGEQTISPEVQGRVGLCIELGEDELQAARLRFFGNHSDDVYSDGRPDVWPYFRIPVVDAFEAACVREIAPRRAHVDILIPDLG